MTTDVTDATELASQRERLLLEAEAFAREALAHDSSGHDWSHVARVRRVAQVIAEAEGAERFICDLAALLHDVADYKIAGDEATGLARVRGWLVAHGADPVTTERVMQIIATMSFAGGERPAMTTLEGKIVQDADRLDAIGAVGVARAFA
ncbi:MAG TPA: HD domain-containing protein, partial [Ktedonobacterales bacterium]